MTTEAHSPTPIPTDRLWRITDVAAYLTLSENPTREVTNEVDAPPPIYERGAVKLWHPAQWDQWARRRAGLDISLVFERAAGLEPSLVSAAGEPKDGLW